MSDSNADSNLHIGNYLATELADHFGDPIYVYDGDRILQQYARLSQAFAAFPHRLLYAIKANANINIIRLMLSAGASIDVVSAPEIEIALHAGAMPEQILFTPNGVGFEEYELAVEHGVRINIDNLSTLERFGTRYGKEIPVCIRLNPHLYAGGHSHIQTGHIDSKFGISVHQLRHVHRIVKAHQLKVEGIHMHTGSDILDAQVFLQGADILFEAAKDFDALSYIDFGSGFKVAYRKDDSVTNVEDLGKQLAERVQAFGEETGRQPEIWFEPGKFLVSESGWLLARVNVVKQTVASTFLCLNTGQNHLIRPMFYDAWHPIVHAAPAHPDVTRVYSVVGYICETDTFGADRMLPETQEGDLLAIGNAGAYGFSMTSNYNCRYRPAEVLILGGNAHLIRKAETIDDLLKNQVEVPILEVTKKKKG